MLFLPMSSKRIRKKRAQQAGQDLFCVMCGRLLHTNAKNYVCGRHGVVCHRCIHTSHLLAEAKPNTKEQTASAIMTPQQLMDKLNTTITGQQPAKRAVSLAMWKQQLCANGMEHVPTSHILLYGPSGCGKTYLATQAAKLCNLPYLVFDSTTLTEAGYKGRNASDVFKDYQAANKGHPKLDYGIIILDEIDKLAGKGSGDRQAHYRGTQHTLLKQLEQNTGLLYILCGAFQGLVDRKEASPIGFVRENPKYVSQIAAESFISYGMERELIGRISAHIAIQALTTADLVALLLEKEGSVFQEYRLFFQQQGIDLVMTEEEAAKFAAAAIQSGTGARGLHTELDRCMEPLMLQVAAGTTEKQLEVSYVEIGNGNV